MDADYKTALEIAQDRKAQKILLAIPKPDWANIILKTLWHKDFKDLVPNERILSGLHAAVGFYDIAKEKQKNNYPPNRAQLKNTAKAAPAAQEVIYEVKKK